MLKREMVWRLLADATLTHAEPAFHQNEIAVRLGMSIGNVNLAVGPLRSIGAVDVVGKALVVRDVRKLLLYWAAHRSSPRLVASYETFEAPREVIRLLPPGITLTSFAGYIVEYGAEPAPLSVVRGYVPDGDVSVTDELSRRFHVASRPDRATLFVYAADDLLAIGRPPVVGPGEMYVDLWNEGDFFASDYIRALETEYHL